MAKYVEIKTSADYTLKNLGFISFPTDAPGLIAQWNKGSICVNMFRSEKENLVLFDILTPDDMGNRKGIEQTQNSLKQMVQEKFPNIKVQVSLRWFPGPEGWPN
jgi:hypothetical protein